MLTHDNFGINHPSPNFLVLLRKRDFNIFLLLRILVSADIEIKNYIIKTIFLSPEGPKARSSKTGINSRILILIFVVNCL